eukprot:GILK01016294.1.p1 GENE.GILK01016294.1~~GILK01016294.1.p1  ORF type:complete len:436 (+),score=73.45 GILK01016294.1:177-1310(+)
MSEPRLSPSVLKSALQKNVRMCRPVAAVRSAIQLLRVSVDDLLRRLTIIVLEDSILHPALPLLTWIMMASARGFTLSTPFVELILRIVHDVAAVRVRDHIPYRTEGSIKDSDLWTLWDESQRFLMQDCALLKSILIRAHFGGMPGDVLMLKRFALVWNQRFSNQQTPPTVPKPVNVPSLHPHPPALSLSAAFEKASTVMLRNEQSNIEASEPRCIPYLTSPAALPAGDSVMTSSPWLSYLHTIHHRVVLSASGEELRSFGPMKMEDVLPSAVDFHCTNIIQDLLKDSKVTSLLHTVNNKIEDPEGLFKSLIWKYRSSQNLKQPLDSDLKSELSQQHGEEEEDTDKSNLWVKLKPFCDRYSYSYIRYRFTPLSVKDSS